MWCRSRHTASPHVEWPQVRGPRAAFCHALPFPACRAMPHAHGERIQCSKSTAFLEPLLHYFYPFYYIISAMQTACCMGIRLFLWALTASFLLAASPFDDETIPQQPSLPWSTASAPVSIRIPHSGLGLLTHADSFPGFAVCSPVSQPARCPLEPGTPWHYAGGWWVQPARRVN